MRCQNRETLVAVGLNWGPRQPDPRLLHNHFDFFSSFFSLACRLIHPYRLSNNLRSDIIRYGKFRTFRSNLLARVFLYVPIIPYRSLRQAVPPARSVGSDGSVPSVCRPYQRQSKQHKCTRGARPCLFLLSLILPGRRRIKPPTHCLAGVARRCGTAPRAPAVEFTTAGHPRRSYALQDVMHVFTAQLALALRPLGFVQVVPRNMAPSLQ